MVEKIDCESGGFGLAAMHCIIIDPEVFLSTSDTPSKKKKLSGSRVDLYYMKVFILKLMDGIAFWLLFPPGGDIVFQNTFSK